MRKSDKCRQGGGGGQKTGKFCRHHLSMVPNQAQSLCNAMEIGESDDASTYWTAMLINIRWTGTAIAKDRIQCYEVEGTSDNGKQLNKPRGKARRWFGGRLFTIFAQASLSPPPPPRPFLLLFLLGGRCGGVLEASLSFSSSSKLVSRTRDRHSCQGCSFKRDSLLAYAFPME